MENESKGGEGYKLSSIQDWIEATDTINGSRVVVMGLGVSGYWAARWLVSMGARVIISEAKEIGSLDSAWVKDLTARGVKIEAGGHRPETLLGARMIVMSPGIPQDMELVTAAKEKGIRVTGELELVSRFIEAPIVAVTGTNGKTTVTTMIGQVLNSSGKKAFIGGNIGKPLAAYLACGEPADVVVAEVSSFQLDTAEAFCPQVAVLLNIARDHLDRYRGFGQYIEAKLRLFQNQKKGHQAVLCDDDPIVSCIELGGGTQTYRYGIKKKKGRDAFISGKKAFFGRGVSQCVSLKDYKLVGRHNQENLLAVLLACSSFGVEAEKIKAVVPHFRPLPHRLEYVAVINGVRFYNDSKATNIEATIRAIESFDRPIVLIAGGRHKGAAYGPLAMAAKGRIKAAVLIGEAAPQLEKDLRQVTPCYRAEKMAEAVKKAYEKAAAGDVVVLSPACSSFDMFSNYEERGQSFKDAVRLIRNGQG